MWTFYRYWSISSLYTFLGFYVIWHTAVNDILQIVTLSLDNVTKKRVTARFLQIYLSILDSLELRCVR